MIARDTFYVEPPTIPPGLTIDAYRRARPVKRRRLAIRHIGIGARTRVRIEGRHGA